ncbi:uncharacterized protein LOC110437481 [Sorghum bicolor]|uniref:uncharacterized protein LOC110437481 n=1 Tax=Sorghum bicolor TaxID=4558 RepID=UPI000B426682|nr:uncharacterized protein LOC110437481 [Sorghum bicolor]|eukprot:XP_021321603.1 uncharacterized protein LOC110437481 [Sorghum bicolor]
MKILLPYYQNGFYILFIQDMQNKIVRIMDPLQDQPCKKGYSQSMVYESMLHNIDRMFNLAMGLSKSKRNYCIYSWKREYPAYVTKVQVNTTDWNLGGFLVYNFMKLRDGVTLPSINNLSTSLRTEFLADILTSRANESYDNIPEDIQYPIKKLENM